MTFITWSSYPSCSINYFFELTKLQKSHLSTVNHLLLWLNNYWMNRPKKCLIHLSICLSEMFNLSCLCKIVWTGWRAWYPLPRSSNQEVRWRRLLRCGKCGHRITFGGSSAVSGNRGGGNRTKCLTFHSSVLIWHSINQNLGKNTPFALFESKIWAIIETAEKYTFCDTILNFETYFKGFNLNFQYWGKWKPL